MRVGVLQFDPKIGKLQENQERADSLLADVGPGDLDLLVLPELAFTGYNFASLSDIREFLEHTASGTTAAWARTTASRLQCLVSVGYPEICYHSGYPKVVDGKLEPYPHGFSRGPPPTHEIRDPGSKEWRTYNSTMMVGPSGELTAHYRKTNLYYIDVTWSWPGPEGFGSKAIDLPVRLFSSESTTHPNTTPTAFGICMDFNPTHFSAPFEDYELATHMKNTGSRLLISSNAWTTQKTKEELAESSNEYDSSTISYWLLRLRPLLETGGGWKKEPGIGADNDESRPDTSENASPKPPDEHSVGALPPGGQHEERIVVISNRIGVEPGPIKAYDLTRGHPPCDDGSNTQTRAELESQTSREDTTTTQIPGAEPAVSNRTDEDSNEKVFEVEAKYAGSSCVFGLRGDGRIRMYGHLGRAQEKLLVVNTDHDPLWIGRLTRPE